MVISAQDRKWLKKVLADCFPDGSGLKQDTRTLSGLLMLITMLIKNIEQNLEQTKALWEQKPDAQEVRIKLEYLKKQLFYLHRFCRGKIKLKGE